jgi:hypothetical protein
MVQSDPTDAHGNLFPIFLLSLIQFFLVPITLWRVRGVGLHHPARMRGATGE